MVAFVIESLSFLLRKTNHMLRRKVTKSHKPNLDTPFCPHWNVHRSCISHWGKSARDWKGRRAAVLFCPDTKCTMKDLLVLPSIFELTCSLHGCILASWEHCIATTESNWLCLRLMEILYHYLNTSLVSQTSGNIVSLLKQLTSVSD